MIFILLILITLVVVVDDVMNDDLKKIGLALVLLVKHRSG